MFDYFPMPPAHPEYGRWAAPFQDRIAELTAQGFPLLGLNRVQADLPDPEHPKLEAMYTRQRAGTEVTACLASPDGTTLVTLSELAGPCVTCESLADDGTIVVTETIDEDLLAACSVGPWLEGGYHYHAMRRAPPGEVLRLHEGFVSKAVQLPLARFVTMEDVILMRRASSHMAQRDGTARARAALAGADAHVSFTNSMFPTMLVASLALTGLWWVGAPPLTLIVAAAVMLVIPISGLCIASMQLVVPPRATLAELRALPDVPGRDPDSRGLWELPVEMARQLPWGQGSVVRVELDDGDDDSESPPP